MAKFKKGDRVIDDHLGPGCIECEIRSSLDSGLVIAYMVLFDKTPDFRYNMAENPTMVFASALNAE